MSDELGSDQSRSIAALESAIAALTSQVEKANVQAMTANAKADALRTAIARINSTSITGPFHSGTIGNGPVFDPSAGGAGFGATPKPATATNPYVMGSNSTANPGDPPNDSWGPDGPSPNPGDVVYDGVRFDTGTAEMSYATATDTRDSGAGWSIQLQTYTIGTRVVLYDSNGAIYSVGVGFFLRFETFAAFF